MPNSDISIPNIWASKPTENDIRNIGIHLRKTARASADSFMGDAPARHTHWHDYVQIWYTVSGEYCNSIYGRDNWLSTGGLLIVPPFVPHKTSGEKGQPVTTVSIDVTSDFIKRLLPASKQRIFLNPAPHEYRLFQLHLQGNDHKTALAFFEKMLPESEKSLKRAMVLYQDEFKAFFEFLADVIKKAGSNHDSQISEKKHKVITQTLDYIAEHYAEPIKLSDMCRLTAMSQTAFCTLFKECTSSTFSQCLYITRIIKSCADISNTDMPMNQIMIKHGFRSKSNFIRLFKLVYGCTPRELRKLRQR